MTWTRGVRIASLVLAPVTATAGMLHAADDQFLRAASPVLIVLWIAMAAALLLRLIAETRRPSPVGRAWPWDHLDVLTATGATLLWSAALAMCLAGTTGWASASWLGTLGLSTVYLVATWTALVAGGPRPWRAAEITRAITPAISIEGDALREAVRIRGMRIPFGMRLFAAGRTTRHGALTRYAITDAGAEVVLESELGGAVRGEHQAPAMALWLGDTLGLTRTPAMYHGEASFTVLPRPGDVQDARGLLGHGGDDALPSPTQHRPTEGTFRIRDYVPGDDARRIHWVRSLQADRLIMRLPDEVPPEDPAVRLVLDTEIGSPGPLGAIDDLSCRAPSQLLDALVHVWLGIARALTASGTRVTLVVAARQGEDVQRVERRVIPNAPREMLRLGARVAWQNTLPLTALLGAGGERQVVVSCRPRQLPDVVEPMWVVVPESAWTSPEAWTPMISSPFLPYPIGVEDNRRGRRRRERQRILRMKQDREVFSQVVCWADWAEFSGNYIARPEQGRVSLTVIA